MLLLPFGSGKVRFNLVQIILHLHWHVNGIHKNSGDFRDASTETQSFYHM